MRLGAHISVAGGKEKAIERAKAIGCECLAIFIRNVRSWTSKPLKAEEIKKFLEKREENKNIRPIMSHNSYLINLANTDDEKLEKSYSAMIDELHKADQLKLSYVNIHPGNKNEDESTQKALKRIAYQLNFLFEETKNSKVKILLETTAGQGNDVGYKFEDLIEIIDEIENKERIGVCFDTCHSFAAGYDFSTIDKYNEMFDNFDEIIGLDYLQAFHLNDAKNVLGSKVDRHEHIGEGEIGLEVFGFFVNDSERFKEHPGILETPKGLEMYEKNLQKLKELRTK
ncbi:MAG: deoxyribonuclease IV [Candidatus Lokiarchaeota archaeon]|nr:deoxyribonuclease IV [Candidatus Lokiarchaeota archaeon]MBD3199896.1 deoxyribonuclease IV [Candidatus Lokiarchaeota archaeon]